MQRRKLAYIGTRDDLDRIINNFKKALDDENSDVELLSDTAVFPIAIQNIDEAIFKESEHVMHKEKLDGYHIQENDINYVFILDKRSKPITKPIHDNESLHYSGDVDINDLDFNLKVSGRKN